MLDNEKPLDKARLGWWTLLSLNCMLVLMYDNHEVICLKWIGLFDPSLCESMHVGVWMSYHWLPGVIKSGIKEPGKIKCVLVYARVNRRVHAYIHIVSFKRSLSKPALYGCNSQSISGTNYGTLLPSDSLKWAWCNTETYPSQIKLCVLIVFMFVGLSTTSEGICCWLMYACCASGNVFYDHYYSNELEMCFESPKSLSMNGYPWRL